VFGKEWAKLTNETFCSRERMHVMGVCNESDVVGDVMERVIAYEVMDDMMAKGRWRPQWWCWPSKWILDVLDFFHSNEKRPHSPIQIEPAYYNSLSEFGMSTMTGTLKVMSVEE
jgi:hypothetical protein